MTPEQLRANVLRHYEIKTATIVAVPEQLAKQVPYTDLLLYQLHAEQNGESIDIDMLMSQQWITNSPDSISWGELLCRELIFCTHEEAEGLITGCVYNFYENRGKPAYFIDPTTGKGIRLASVDVPPLPDSPALRELIKQMQLIPGIVRVSAELIVTDELHKLVNCPNNRGIVFCLEEADTHNWRDNQFDAGTNPFWFVYPENVWDDETDIPGVIETIKQTLEAHRAKESYPELVATSNPT